jgi:hypothetical protein
MSWNRLTAVFLVFGFRLRQGYGGIPWVNNSRWDPWNLMRQPTQVVQLD